MWKMEVEKSNRIDSDGEGKYVKSNACFISNTTTILQAMEQLDKLPIKILFVVDEGNRLKASVTDGDIRRAILAGVSLNATTMEYANFNPLFVNTNDKSKCKEILKKRGIIAIPVLTDDGVVENIYYEIDEIEGKQEEKIDIPVVVMAGGLGTRLYPYTKILPKPLIPIEDTPISERIIDSFFEKGCQEFYMIVNHKRNMIKAYYNDINKPYRLEFIDEDIPLGTAGGLRLLKDTIKHTFVLTNCDILIMDNIREIYNHHRKNENQVTMVCSLKNYKIPYGVVNFSEGGTIESLEEKPQMSFFTNTGYYILDPVVFDYIGINEKIGMPDVIMRMKSAGLKVGIYPIGENAWLDMGQMDTMDDMERRLKEMEK